MEATPLAHVAELAPATKLTGDPTVAPFPGLLTLTLETAVVAKPAIKQIHTQKLLISTALSD